MNIYIGADHRGFQVKEEIKPWLMGQGREVIDCGNDHLDPADDFPDFAFAVASRVVADPGSRGIVICGSAGGVVIAANKVKDARAVMAVTQADVRHNREHNDANILGIAADYLSLEQARKLTDIFLNTKYLADERFERRLGKIRMRER